MGKKAVSIAVGLGLVGGLGAMLLMGGTAKAAGPSKTVTKAQVSADKRAISSALRAASAEPNSEEQDALIQEAVAAAIASGNPEIMAQVADELEPLGYAYADQLRAQAVAVDAVKDPAKVRATPAEVVEATQDLTPAETADLDPSLIGPEEAAADELEDADDHPGTPAYLSEPREVMPEPEEDLPPPPAGADPNEQFATGQALSSALNAHLASTGKGNEDRGLVEEFQAAYGLKPDGKYGTTTALEFGSFGVVPIHPFYLKTDWLQDLKDYKAGLTALSKEFPDSQMKFALAAREVNA